MHFEVDYLLGRLVVVCQGKIDGYFKIYVDMILNGDYHPCVKMASGGTSVGFV